MPTRVSEVPNGSHGYVCRVMWCSGEVFKRMILGTLLQHEKEEEDDYDDLAGFTADQPIFCPSCGRERSTSFIVHQTDLFWTEEEWLIQQAVEEVTDA